MNFIRFIFFAMVLVMGASTGVFLNSTRGDELQAKEEGADKQILWELTVEGNRNVSTNEIEEAIISSESSHIPIFGSKREFNPIAFQADQKRIEHLYLRLGFYQARVMEAQVQPCSKQGRVCVTLVIEEGEPTRISNIRIQVKGSTSVESTELLNSFAMAAGDQFHHDRYLASKEAVLMYLKKNSYPLPKIEGEAAYHKESNQVALTLNVTPGTKARIGNISFKGLDEILPEDAMSKLPIQTGQWYDPQAFEDAESLLANLDIFRTIDPSLHPQTDNPSVVDVIYHVREKPLKTLQFGAGVRIDNSRQEARLRGEWTNRNFYKHLRKFTVRGEPRYAVLPSIFDPQQSGPLGTLEVSMLHPAFLSPRQDLRTAIGFDSDLEQGYRWFGPRILGNLERQVSRSIRVSGGYTFRYLTFYHVDILNTGTSKFLPDELLFNRRYRLGFIDQFLTWDRRDQIIEPRRGTFAELQLAESSPILGSAFTYLKLRPELRGYVPATRRATVAAKVAYGQMLTPEDRQTPITERFYGGGSSSHRGFSYHRLSPSVRTLDGRTVPVGGNVLFEASIEPRVQMVRLADRWLIGAVFLDIGDVVQSPSDLSFRNLHYAVGTGVRYETPIGIIRADVGFRINRLDELTEGRANPDPGQLYAIHVSFGESF